MRVSNVILLVMVLATVCAMVAPAVASENRDKPFIELSTGDLTRFCGRTAGCITPTGEVYYDRVDGLLFYVGAQYRSETRLHPRLRAMTGWPSAFSHTYYRLEIEQPIHSQDSFSFGVNLYDVTAWNREDDERTTDLANNIFSLFARSDDRDYFERHGVTVFAQEKFNSQLTVRAEYRSDRLSSLPVRQSVWSLFERDDDWRENPPLEIGVLSGAEVIEGKKRMNSYVWSIVYGSQNEDRTDGWLARGFFEFGGGGAGGDYDFRKHVIDVTKDLAITDTQTLSLTGVLGLASGTDFPSHKLFHLGGRGDLRGYDYKEFSGKDLVFGRIEYLVAATRNLDIIYFLESGSADYSTSTPDSDGTDGYKHDAGIGLRIEAPWAGWVRVDAARAFEEDADVNLYLSLLLET
jgi:outer membrane protein assembly factor BamA